MEKIAKLKIVDSYHDIFLALTKDLQKKRKDIDQKNLVFLEEKVSLMAERHIVSALGGTFNTEVYSFGKFLRAKNPNLLVLSKEGSAMILKRIIHGLELKCFSSSKSTLAPSVYELITQLKSASISSKDVLDATSQIDGILKNKLLDISLIYDEYENFIQKNNLVDQSRALGYLPDIILNDQKIKDADVYLVGYVGWTEQARNIVDALIKSAKSVTAILPNGSNKQLFVGETTKMFEDICKRNGVNVEKEYVISERSVEGTQIANTVFSPSSYTNLQTETDNVWEFFASTIHDEIKRVGETLKASVMKKGLRFSDFSIAVPDVQLYRESIKTIFSKLEIPFFIDERKDAKNHPLVRLILSYVDAFRKNLEKKALSSFYKNPLVESDKKFLDRFENYLFKNNITYDKIKQPFTKSGIDLERANRLRELIVDCFTKFDVKALLTNLKIKEKLEDYSLMLENKGLAEESAVNGQIYDAVTSVLKEMDTILYGVPLTNKEFKDIFLSGVTALQLSIIPQYTDAVFVGGYKEVALARAKYLFMVGLTSDVPSAKEDVAILNDGELDKLKTLKLLIEPKISIVNKRNYESTGLCLSSFAEKLFISYPLTSSDGKENVKSELVEYLRSTFTVKNLSFTDEFLTVSEALTHFAKQCGNFSSCKIDDIPEATAFYQLVNSNKEIADKIGGKDALDNLLTDANKEFKVRLSGNRNILLRNTISPTTIESYYSCPYKAFLSKTLQLNDRDEGEVSPMSVGNIVHKIFELFLKNLTAFTEEGYINALNKAINDTVNSDDFCVYLEDVETNEMMLRAVNEAKIVCRKMYEKQLKSKFITAHYEVPFGDGQYFPALEIANGKYKMKGKIDRVDYYDDYFRVVDYKTGTNFDVSGKGLFTGTSLQLYLYSKIISDKENKQLAGMYYLPVNESYKKTAQEVEGFELKGKTIEDENIITAMDSDFETYGKALGVSKLKKGGFSGATGKDSLNAQLEYALKMCENATTQMASGVIASSPVEEECKYCAYKGLCSSTDLYTRKVGEVDQSVIDGGIKGDKTDG